MKFRNTSFLFLFLLLSQTAFAALPEVTITFDRQTVNVGEEVHLKIRIESAGSAAQRPRLPSIESFTTYYTGHSAQSKEENGQTVSISEFNFAIVPNVVGKFTFPPVEVEVEGRMYRTSTVEFEVLGKPGMKSTTHPSSPSVPHMGSATTPAGNVASSSQPPGFYQIPKTQPQGFVPPGADPNIFLKAWVDKTAAYPNEPIVLTYSLYTRQDTQYEGFSEEPVITGFWIEQFPSPEKLDKNVVQIAGKRYVRADVRRMVLFPQGSGEYNIQPGTAKVSVEERSHYEDFMDEFFDDSFFSSRIYSKKIPKVLSTQPITISVKPFPENGKPAGFNGATGHFTFTGTVDKRTVKQSEPVTMTLTIEGEGNIETLERPPLPVLAHVEVYDSDVSSQLLERKDAVMGRKTFQVMLMPEAVGELDIPPVEFSFFDPRTVKYTTLRTEAFRIQVQQGEGEPALPLKSREESEKRKGVELEARDIFFIKDRLEIAPLERANPLRPFLLIANAIATLLALFIVLYLKRQEELDTNIALKRRIHAPRAVRRGLRQMGKLMKDNSRTAQQKFCEIAQKTLNGYVSAQMNVSAQSLTVPMVEEALATRGESPETIDRLKSFYDLCNQVRFTDTDIDHQKKEEILDTVEIVSKSMAKKK